MAAKKPTIWVKGLGSLVMFGLISGLLWPRAAVDVQAVGDGAEMAMAAVLGSLVHPPGFPILGHINQFLFDTFDGQAYAILAKASVVEHALAGAFILWKVSSAARTRWESQHCKQRCIAHKRRDILCSTVRQWTSLLPLLQHCMSK